MAAGNMVVQAEISQLVDKFLSGRYNTYDIKRYRTLTGKDANTIISRVKKLPGASESPSATAAMNAQKKETYTQGAKESPSATAAMQAAANKTQGAKESPSVTAAMQAQKNADAAKQNQLLQAMLNDKQTTAYNQRQKSEMAVNETIYEKYLAGYRQLVNRLEHDARDTTSKQKVQEEIDKYIAKLDNPESEVTRDGLTQYLAYTNQTEQYRDLLLANASVDMRNTNNAHMNNARHSESVNIDYAIPTGNTAGINEKQIANITSAQEAYKLSVDLARQINAVVPDTITTGVIGYEGNAATGEKTPIYGYVVAKYNIKVTQLTNLLSATNKQLVKLLNKETEEDAKTFKTIGADKISEYSRTVSDHYDPQKIANNLLAAQYRAFYLVTRYNNDAAMYGAPEGYDFSKDNSKMAQRIAQESVDADNAMETADNMFNNIANLQMTESNRRKLYYYYYDGVEKYFGKYMTAEQQENVRKEKLKYTDDTTVGTIKSVEDRVQRTADSILYGKGDNYGNGN